MQQDGYLYLKAFLNSQKVWQARQEIAVCLAAEGSLELEGPVLDCIAKPGLDMRFRPDLASRSSTLKTLLYSGRMMEFLGVFLGGQVRHYDYTWLRAVAPGKGTYNSYHMGPRYHCCYSFSRFYRMEKLYGGASIYIMDAIHQTAL